MPRGRGENLTDSEREAFGEEALLMHAEGKTYREIGEALGVSRPTVKSLIDRALEKTADERGNAKARQLAAYRRLLREVWRRLAAFPQGSTTQNVTGLANAARSILERMDKLLGVEAPTKTRHEQVTVDWSKLPDQDVHALAAIVERNPDVFDALLKQD